ncbi:transglycosylase [Roseibium denhamense]|nr:MltA domain-containing protein [Roseibium denhamense]MTI04174.1 transglycosylase [Roseibium denhamense]
MAKSPPPDTSRTGTSFASLEGWNKDAHHHALSAFMRFCERPKSLTKAWEASNLAAADVRRLCKIASDVDVNGPGKAQQFFETYFIPSRVDARGFVTGYYEPEVAASRTRSDTFSHPLYRKPPGLEAVTRSNRPKGWPGDISHGRRLNGKLTELPDRAAIMEGALDGENLELVWLADPVDAFFIHIQGSARLRLNDGGVMRVGYAGKTGHPYTGIGRLLVERGLGTPEDFTMSGLRQWLADNPHERDPLFMENRSFIFFREVTDTRPELGPVGGASLPLVAGRSLAVDTRFLSYGSLVYVTAAFSDPDRPSASFQRLMTADDTGSAIKGHARGDIFIGSGDRAGEIAGDIRHEAAFTILLPNPDAIRTPY